MGFHDLSDINIHQPRLNLLNPDVGFRAPQTARGLQSMESLKVDNRVGTGVGER